MSVLYSNSRIFVIPVCIFNGRKQTLVDTIRILSALCMRGLHDKRHLLAKLRICGSENWNVIEPIPKLGADSVLSVHYVGNLLNYTHVQGSIYTMNTAEGGYVTAGKDGCLSLWDPDFRPITKIDLHRTKQGYPGKHVDLGGWRKLWFVDQMPCLAAWMLLTLTHLRLFDKLPHRFSLNIVIQNENVWLKRKAQLSTWELIHIGWFEKIWFRNGSIISFSPTIPQQAILQSL